MRHLKLIEGLPDHERYSSPASYLYDRIEVPDGIRVAPTGRLARLVIARESGCLISWQTGRKTAKNANGTPYEPTVEVSLEEVSRA